MKTIFVLATILLLAASSQARASKSADIFEHPENYLGQHVRLCGFFHDGSGEGNVWLNERAARERRPGLGFLPARDPSDERYNMRLMCVSGVIVKTDCGGGGTPPPTDESSVAKICTWSIYDYALQEEPTS